MRGGRLARWARTAAGAALILLLWWLGEAITAHTGVPVPGPVVGLGLLLALLGALPRLRETVTHPAMLLVGVLGALIVPAAVMLGDGVPGVDGPVALRLAAVLVLTTLATGVVTALVWRLLSR
jgi:putative effector of murein hydrolase LrgA (UPF0299 family)